MKSYKSRGIVLNSIKYGDSSIIVHMLTETFGRQSYMIQGIRSTKAKGSKMALFQPMFALVYEGLSSPNMEMHRMRDIHNGLVLQSIPYDIRKSTIALFMAETLYRLIGESEANTALFNFVWGSVEALDELQNGISNFHLWFLANISRFLGFSPGNEYATGDLFDMREGLFCCRQPLHNDFIDNEYAEIFRNLLECNVNCLEDIGLNRNKRVGILNFLIAYYSIHLESVSRIQSIRILQEVF